MGDEGCHSFEKGGVCSRVCSEPHCSGRVRYPSNCNVSARRKYPLPSTYLSKVQQGSSWLAHRLAQARAHLHPLGSLIVMTVHCITIKRLKVYSRNQRLLPRLWQTECETRMRSPIDVLWRSAGSSDQVKITAPDGHRLVPSIVQSQATFVGLGSAIVYRRSSVNKGLQATLISGERTIEDRPDFCTGD